MLFDKARHEALCGNVWNKDVVQSTIMFIVHDIEKSLLPGSCWPTHPLDAESYPRAGPLWSAYAGAAGTVHALQILRRYGYQIRDLTYLLTRIHESYLRQPDVSVEPGLQLGELGIMLPALLAQPANQELEEKLIRRMEATINLPLYEITSGQSGMMHAALALYRQTGKTIWKDLYIRGATALLESWKYDSKTKEWLWESQVFGVKRCYYGACHGVVGNANILFQGIDLLESECSELILARTVDTLSLSVEQNLDTANWVHYAKPNVKKMLVQWCHGAAGIITAMARTPDTNSGYSHQLDKLLTKAGELVWQAGPLKKGSNICHGTAGNGYAFLYLYHRWGDKIWLDRARKFAMHAIEQCQKDRLSYGQGRYTLWTGDAGLAIYLNHCLYPETAAIPGLDLF
ncbi:LanC-like protein [Rheinheimera soli]|nr:LanC-like protein [Rheinheimera soli]